MALLCGTLILSQSNFIKSINYGKANTDHELFVIYFMKLKKKSNGITKKPMEVRRKQCNYDETNLLDESGSKNQVTRSEAKYPQQIQNYPKSYTFIMVCGNTAGNKYQFTLATNTTLWCTWTENRPQGAKYNDPKTGWLNYQIFQGWFIYIT